MEDFGYRRKMELGCFGTRILEYSKLKRGGCSKLPSPAVLQFNCSWTPIWSSFESLTMPTPST